LRSDVFVRGERKKRGTPSAFLGGVKGKKESESSNNKGKKRGGHKTLLEKIAIIVSALSREDKS